MKPSSTTPRISLALLVAVAACAKPAIQQQPTSSHPVVPTAHPNTQGDSASVRLFGLRFFQPGDVSYDYRATSTVQVISGDSLPRRDTISVSALIIARFREPTVTSPAIRAIVQVDSITTRVGNNNVPLTLPSHTDTLSINTTSGKVIDRSSSASGCSPELPIRVDEILPRLPSSQKETWSDTLDRQLCRAGIQLHAQEVATYHVYSTTPDFQLLRTTVTTFNGTGTQWNQAVEVMGQSTATDTLILNTGNQYRLRRIHGASQLQLTFKSRLRNQQFEQITQRVLELR